MYLTFTALSDAVTFKFTNITEYSINDGEWIELSANTNTPELNNGDTIKWRSGLEPTATGIGTFSSTGDFSVSGSPFSLLYGSSYTNQSDLLNGTNVFCALFKNAIHLVGASNIELATSSLTLNCYKEMFMGCTSLTTIPALSITSLAEGCYQSMFQGCTALTSCPTLPATTMAKNCYNSMFYGCTSITACPTLSATTLAEGCYQNMFRECTSITGCPTLSATSLAINCYNAMFMGCTSLTILPALPATVMVSGCYQNMFRDCTSLTSTPPQLSSVTNLALNCWNAMFMGCTSLTTTPTLPNISIMTEACYASFLRGTGITTAPTLPASPTLAKNCYYAMFMDCANLANNIPTILNGALKEGCYAHMFRNCTSLVTAPELPATGLAVSCYTQMFDGCTALKNFQENLPGTSLQVSCYSYMFRNCTSLVDAPEIAATSMSSTANNYCCQYMFYGCTSLKNPPSILRPTTIKNYAYTQMFAGCTSLETAPVLQASTLGTYCYDYMFNGCTSLEEAPYLKATTLQNYCYRGMFQNCTSLINVQETLPALTLPDYCYYAMFNGCTSLVTPPNIAATTTNKQYACAYMFQNCTSLIEGPQILSTTTGSYVFRGMFNGCTNMVSGPTELKAASIATYAYSIMFQNCTSLISAPEIKGTSVPGGYNCTAMFAGCTSLVNASEELKPVTMTNNCYMQMFQGCTSLVTAPIIDATTITSKHNNCFNQMFNGCTSLVTPPPEIKVTAIMVNGTTSEGTFYRMFFNCSSLKSTPEIKTTTLTTHAFYQMFQGCSSLTDIRKIHATSTKNYSHTSMFAYCTSLKVAPKLPATGLSQYCYYCMFYGCTGLEIPSELPATTLQPYCYKQMYQGCTSLKYAPLLPAFTMTQQCYWQMFYGCTSLEHATIQAKAPHNDSCVSMFANCTSMVRLYLGLNTLGTRTCNTMCQNCKSLKYVKAQFTTAPNTSRTNNWMSGVPAGGIFVKANGANSWNVVNAHGVPSGWTIKLITENTALRFNIITDGDIKFYCRPDEDEISFTKTVSISSDSGTTWTEITSSPSGTSLGDFTAGETVFIKGNNLSYDNNYFNGSAEVGLTGNIQNLVYGDSYQNRYGSSAPYAFRGLFSGYSNLKNINNLIFPVSYIYNEHEGYCESMFESCEFTSGVMKHGELLAMKLSKECYKNMFYGCTQLITPTKLPALTLAEGCYKEMFMSTSIEEIPEISVSEMAPHSCEGMFKQCYSLNEISTIYAKKMAPYCCKEMFSNCSYLTKVNSIETNELAEGCYQNMFEICSNLDQAPELSNMTLAEKCYERMFYECDSLTTAPILPAKQLVTDCYKEMFLDCWSLNNITGLFFTQPDPSYTLDWVKNVAESGTFYRSPNADWMVLGTCGIPEGWVIKDSYIGEYLTIESLEDNNDITITNINIVDHYSLDHGLTWEPLNEGDIISIETGETVAFKGHNTGDENAFYTATKEHKVYGNAMSTVCEDFLNTETRALGYLFDGCNTLIDAGNLILPNKLSRSCYYFMFCNCTSLTTAPELPATTLTDYCYYAMFSGCTSLTNAPELPATTLAEGCYANMFDVCTSLTNAPELPATTLAKLCYSGMFHNCTSLVNAPELLATILAESCYSDMFLDCTSLITAPELPATTLVNNCYANMFEFCTSLVDAPELPAITLSTYCYEYMFSGCTSLTNAPELPATVLKYHCYDYMFNGCTNLNYIKAMFMTTPGTSYTMEWVNGVASEGTFVKNSAATWNVTGDNGIPVGWVTKGATPNTYTDIDPNFVYDGLPISLLDIKTVAEHDMFENNVGWTPNSRLNSMFIVNNFYRTCPWAGEENFWKQVVNDKYVRFTDNDYNSFFKNTYSEYANIAYVLNDYTSWQPYIAQGNLLSNDLLATINTTDTFVPADYTMPNNECWYIYQFKISDLLGISIGNIEMAWQRAAVDINPTIYILNRNYNNITLFLIMIQTYMMLSKNVERECDYNKEIRVLGEEFLNNVSINITKTICCSIPRNLYEYNNMEYDKLLSNTHINWFFGEQSSSSSVWGYSFKYTLEDSLSENEEYEFYNSLIHDINIISSHGNLSYRILFPLIILLEGDESITAGSTNRLYELFGYCSWVMEISYPSDYTITINDIKWGLNHMYGNKYFLVNDALSPSIQGIYVNYQQWNYSKYIDSELRLRYYTDTNKMYIHFINYQKIGYIDHFTGKYNPIDFDPDSDSPGSGVFEP